MSDVIMPPLTRVASSQFHYVDSTGLTRGVYTGATETTAYGGDRLGAAVTLVPVGGLPAVEQAKRASVVAWMASLRGRQNRTWMPDHAYRRRGAFPTGELIANNIFTGGITGWAAANGAIITAVDGALRVTLGGSTANPQAGISTDVTVNAPYVARAFLRGGRGALQPTVQATDGTLTSAATVPVTDGMAIVAIVPAASPLTFKVYAAASSPIQAGDFFECLYASVSRCMLADGGPNLLLHSDTPGGTSWSLTNATANVNGSPGPDGLTDAFYLAETAVTGGHSTQQSVTVSSAAQDITFSVYIQAINRGFAALQMLEATGGTAVTCYFNTTTGAVGVTQGVGANWANMRAAVAPCGGSWFRISMTARKTNASTSISASVSPAIADAPGAYLGVSSPVAMLTWRATVSASSFPTRATQTVAAAVAASNNAAGFLYVKGLPPSTQSLLLAGDQVQVGTQIVILTTSLDADAFGLGYMQFSPPLRYSPGDGDPVIVHNPISRFIFTGQYPEWDNVPGVSTTASMEFEEDCFP